MPGAGQGLVGIGLCFHLLSLWVQETSPVNPSAQLELDRGSKVGGRVVASLKERTPPPGREASQKT